MSSGFYHKLQNTSIFINSLFMYSIQLNKHNALESTSDINDLFSSKKIMINDLNPPDDDHCIIYSSLLQLMIVMLLSFLV